MRKMKDEFSKKFEETKEMFRLYNKKMDYEENSTSVDKDGYTSMKVKKKEDGEQNGK